MEMNRLIEGHYSSNAVKLYCILCAKANWKDGKWITGHGEITVKKGDLITSQDNLSEICHMSRDKIRTALKHLLEGQFITLETTKTYTRIHIVKYSGNEKYLFLETKTSPTNPQENPTIEDVKMLRPKIKDTALPYPLPSPETSPDKCLVLTYKTTKGFAFDDRDWDKANWGRCAQAAKTLMGLCKDLPTAEACLKGLGEEYDTKGLSWTLETICRNAGEWLKRHGRIDENASRAGLRMALAGRKTERTGQKGLEPVSEGKILSAFRGGEDTQEGNQPNPETRAGGGHE